MSDVKTIAEKMLKRGYSVIPVNACKEPAVGSWGAYQVNPIDPALSERFFGNAFGLACLMGGPMGLTGLDFDLKYALDSDLYDRFKALIPKSILKKMYVQSTRNAGYHWVWKCPERISGNQKLAQRLTTPEEKHEVYMEAYMDVKRRPTALKLANNHKVKVLIETRGEGGYILMPPTPGYSAVYGKISEITPDEHDLILETARQFNEYVEPVKDVSMWNRSGGGINPFEEFNMRGDAVKLLLDNGWSIVHESAVNIRFRRPGNDASTSSAIYDKETKIFNVFSTSTIFDVGRGYKPSNVFTVLEADGDSSMAYKMLCDLGYNLRVE